MRLPPPLIAAVGVLALALASGIALAVSGPSSVQAQTPAVQVVDVTMDDGSINPRHIVVKANQPVRFVVSGTGVEEHRFNVIGMGMERLRSDQVLPGGSITIDATFTAGTYHVWCSSGGHDVAGMVGTLTVVPADQDAVLNVPVQMGEFFFSPMAATAVAGQTTRFQIQNGGRFDHIFHITGQGLDVQSPIVPGGEAFTLDMMFDSPGTYRIRCSFVFQGREHTDFGMLGTIEVLRGAGAM